LPQIWPFAKEDIQWPDVLAIGDGDVERLSSRIISLIDPAHMEGG